MLVSRKDKRTRASKDAPRMKRYTAIPIGIDLNEEGNEFETLFIHITNLPFRFLYVTIICFIFAFQVSCYPFRA
ncbi:hypothetical protein BDV11DRAFT_194355 [Aspergillus similis]